MPEEQKAWPLYGYAPGDYAFTCSDCSRSSLQCSDVGFADKRATMCLECAVKRAKRELAHKADIISQCCLALAGMVPVQSVTGLIVKEDATDG